VGQLRYPVRGRQQFTLRVGRVLRMMALWILVRNELDHPAASHGPGGGAPKRAARRRVRWSPRRNSVHARIPPATGYDVFERFHEEGESAKTTDRSQLQALLEVSRRSTVPDGVEVHAPDWHDFPESQAQSADDPLAIGGPPSSGGTAFSAQ
jgi:hypothetical protein